jgi:SpoVK/Ycf46/Vps4 family AAA+-type ATPase
MITLMAEPYQNNAQHLLAGLKYLDLLIQREVVRSRSTANDTQDVFKGMYISDADVDHMFQMPEQRDSEEMDELTAHAAVLGQEVDARCVSSLEQGVPLALPRVALLFGLSSFEQCLLLLALSPDVDPKYERLFGYLHDDVSRRRATVGLALRLLCSTAHERIERMITFSPQAPLFRNGLMKPLHREESILRRSLVLEEMTLNYLLGVDGRDPEFNLCVRAFSGQEKLEDLRWKTSFTDQLFSLVRQFVEHDQGSEKRLVFHLYGPHGTGKKTLAGALCRALGIALLVVDMQELLHRFADVENVLRSVFRHAVLLQAAVYLDHFDVLTAEEGKPASHRQGLVNLMEQMSWMAFLGTEFVWNPGDLFAWHEFVTLELPAPDVAERKHIWTALAAETVCGSDVDWEDLSIKFRLTPGRMKSALHHAATLARLRKQDAAISSHDLYCACQSQSNRKLAALAQKMSPRYRWKDIVLPAPVLAQLHEICAQLKHRKRVYTDWGFEGKLSRSKGLCALFHGQSGVGKTMAAEVLARELDLEIYKIDLSTVVSKYIGETEKNLSKIFQEAEDSNAILFFDEADALFGKRSEVKDAHDRYANIEINYLLQRVEEFDGLVVLATNLRRNIDDGFFRRMHFAVEFPFPDEAYRFLIWKQHIPEEAPLGGDIDLDFLAKRFVLSGGNIRNVVVNAAFLAAQNSSQIHMEHLIRATKREFEKIGKICTENDFSPFQSMLRETANGCEELQNSGAQ